jgi:hypothetical protein
MESVTQFITQKLRLKVNEAKSAVARPQERRFLGFSFSGIELKARDSCGSNGARPGGGNFVLWCERHSPASLPAVPETVAYLPHRARRVPQASDLARLPYRDHQSAPVE